MSSVEFDAPHSGPSVPRFGVDAEKITVEQIPLDNARDQEKFGFAGNVLICPQASTDGRVIDVAFNQAQQNDPIPFGQGAGFGGIDFNNLYITHGAQPGETIQLMYFRVEEPGTFWINPVEPTTTTTIQKDNNGNTRTDTDITTGTTDPAVNANSDRERVTVQAAPSNGENLRVGYTVADDEGIVLTPGSAFTFETTEEVRVRNPSTNANTQTFMVTEELD